MSGRVLRSVSAFFFPESFLQATSDKTGSVGFTQTGGTANVRGITGNVTNGKTGYSPYYQWGRKDAFRSAQYTTAPAANTSLVYSATYVTIGTTIQNPTIFYNKGGGSGRTAYGEYTVNVYNNAWNATYADLAGESTANIDGLEKTVKTVYDPCPVGYAVPPGNAFTIFTDSNMPIDGSIGRIYTKSNGEKLYFPCTGARMFNDGTLTWLDIGYSWYAVNGDEKYGRRSVFPVTGHLNIVCVDWNGVRSHGHVIRPVREN